MLATLVRESPGLLSELAESDDILAELMTSHGAAVARTLSMDKVDGGVECGGGEAPSSDGQVARGPWPEAAGAGMNGGVEECDGLAEELAVDIDMQLPGTTV